MIIIVSGVVEIRSQILIRMMRGAF